MQSLLRRSLIIIVAVAFPLVLQSGFLFAGSLIFPVGDPIDGSPYTISQTFQDEPFTYKGKLYSGHLGEDWAVPQDTKVFSISSGCIVRSRNFGGDWGNVIIVRHRDLIPSQTIYSMYAHLRARLVGENTYISDVSEPIGLSGIKGTGPHLHFEVKDYGITEIVPGPGYTQQEAINADSLVFNSVTYFRPTTFLSTTTPPDPGPPSTMFTIGNIIETTTNLNVRSLPNLCASPVGIQPPSSQGTVIDGPVFTDGFWWWNIDYDSGPDGWSVEDFLETISLPPHEPNVAFFEGWESVPLGMPLCETSLDGFTNCAFTADSGQWTVGEFEDESVSLSSVEILPDKILKIQAPEDEQCSFVTCLGAGASTYSISTPLTQTTTLSFTDHIATLPGDTSSSSYIGMSVFFDAPGFSVPCPGTEFNVVNIRITYIFERDPAFNFLPAGICSANVNIGPVSSFSRNLYDDFAAFVPLSPEGWTVFSLGIGVSRQQRLFPPPPLPWAELWATWDNIQVTE